MYGPRFVDDYGDAPPMLWRAAIERLTDEQLARGFENLATDASQWPPTLPAFVEACRRKAPVRFLGVPLTDQQRRDLLPQLPASRETIERHLRSIREKLASSRADG